MGITSLGIGSGLDSESIVTQLVALKKEPINALATKASTIQTKISTYGKIQSAVSALQTAAQKLTNPSNWTSTKATSSDSTALSVATGSNAAGGNYNVQVNQLAATQSVVANAARANSSATVGSGTLTLKTGSWSGNVFTPKSGTTPTTINIAASDSLGTIRDKINAASAGVTASIVTDANGARLVMQSSSTGAANGFQITADDDDTLDNDATGLSSLAYNPPATLGTTRTQTAANALATINGVAVESSENNLNEVVSGLSFTLNKVTTSPVTVSVAQDTEAIAKSISDFATAYTSLATLLQENTKYDAGSKSAGVLQGDSTALSILNQFRSLMSAENGASSTFPTLSAIGLETQSGGGLRVNSDKLNNALKSNAAEVKKLLANTNSGNTSLNGVAVRINTLSSSMLGIGGVFATRTEGLKQSVKNNEMQQSVLKDRASAYEKMLRAQYGALDLKVAGLNSQGDYVSQMINSFNYQKN